MLIVENGYIDCLQVDKKWRRRRIGYELIAEYISNYELPKTLRILHNNNIAKAFWNNIFVLKELESNPFDSLYAICELKDDAIKQKKNMKTERR